jgi:hypothetical protein
LQIVQGAGCGEALYGGNRGTLGIVGKRQAGADGNPVHVYRTGAADSMLAACVGARELRLLAHKIQEAGTGCAGCLNDPAINDELERLRFLMANCSHSDCLASW